jgi:proteasome accessory factor C
VTTARKRKTPAKASKATRARRADPPKAPRSESPATRKDPRDRLRRILFLVPYAVRHPGIPVRELARRCGCTERELLEDLDFLLGVGSPPFAPDDFLDLYVEGERVYVALHQSFSRPPRFTESEAAALAAAARALGGEGRERAVKALRDAVPRDRRASFDELVDRIYAGAPPARESVLGRLQRAIAERRVVRLAYHSASREAESVRSVHPWTLAQRFGHWYLYGLDPPRDRPLAFRLDRMR